QHLEVVCGKALPRRVLPDPDPTVLAEAPTELRVVRERADRLRDRAPILRLGVETGLRLVAHERARRAVDREDDRARAGHVAEHLVWVDRAERGVPLEDREADVRGVDAFGHPLLRPRAAAHDVREPASARLCLERGALLPVADERDDDVAAVAQRLARVEELAERVRAAVRARVHDDDPLAEPLLATERVVA